MTFVYDTVRAGWYLHGNVPLQKLELDFPDIVAIDEDSFHFVYFNRVTELIMRRMPITILHSDTFAGFHTLKSLTMDTFSEMQILSENLIGTLNETLESISMSNFGRHPIDLYNLTGCTEMSRLKIVTIRNSFIPKIEKNSFLGLTVVTNLTLSNCHLETIATGAFDSIAENIQLIDLSFNKLTVLGFELFIYFVNMSQMIIILSENNWICEEFLQEFLCFTEDYPETFVDFPCSVTDSSTTTIQNELSTTPDDDITTTQDDISTTPGSATCVRLSVKLIASIVLIVYV